MPVFGVLGCGEVPGGEGEVAVGLLLVGVWSPVVGAWDAVGFDGFGWAADESVGAGVSTGGRSSED